MLSVIIIGAGPAGCLAAILLARGGFNVDLFEQHPFPREKVCGECLSGLGMDVLGRAGVLAALTGAGSVTLTRTLLHPTDGPTIDVPLPRPSMGISRATLDRLLLGVAIDAGVRVHQPARCESIQTGSVPSIVWRNLQSNECHTTAADWILIADGKGSLLKNAPKASGDLGIKCHFENVNGPRDAIELFAGDGNYGGLAAIENDRWNAAFSVPAIKIKNHSGDLQALFGEIVARNQMLSQRMHGARRTCNWLASPLPRFAVLPSWPDRVIPIGNAVAALEPVGGEGMGLALRSAELTANALLGGTPKGIKALRAEFDSLWRVRRAVCRGVAMVFSRPDVSDFVAPLLDANKKIPATIMRWAGKSVGER